MSKEEIYDSKIAPLMEQILSRFAKMAALALLLHLQFRQMMIHRLLAQQAYQTAQVIWFQFTLQYGESFYRIKLLQPNKRFQPTFFLRFQ